MSDKTFTELVDELERARDAWTAEHPDDILHPLTWDRALATSLDNRTPVAFPDDILARWRQTLVRRAADQRLALEHNTRQPWRPGTKVWLVTGSPAHLVVSDSLNEVKAIAWGPEGALPLSLPVECWTDVEPTDVGSSRLTGWKTPGHVDVHTATEHPWRQGFESASFIDASMSLVDLRMELRSARNLVVALDVRAAARDKAAGEPHRDARANALADSRGAETRPAGDSKPTSPIRASEIVAGDWLYDADSRAMVEITTVEPTGPTITVGGFRMSRSFLPSDTVRVYRPGCP